MDHIVLIFKAFCLMCDVYRCFSFLWFISLFKTFSIAKFHVYKKCII